MNIVKKIRGRFHIYTRYVGRKLRAARLTW